MEINKNQFEAWKQDPVTKEVFALIKGYQEVWLRKKTVDTENADRTLQMTNYREGMVDGLGQILDLDFERE